SEDNTAHLWDADGGGDIAVLRGHTAPVWSAAFSADGRRVVTASEDKTARLWDADGGGEIAVLRGHAAALSSAAVSPGGPTVVTAPYDGTALIWHVFSTTQGLVNRAKERAARCLTPDQRAQFFLDPAPPAWCIEMKKWPYNTPEWEKWLSYSRAGEKPPLPVSA